MTDELRRQLAWIDPMPPAVPVESPATPSSRTRMEHIMNLPPVPLVDPPVDPLVDHPESGPSPDDTAPARARRLDRPRRRWTLAAGAAAAAVTLVGAAVVVNLGGDDGGSEVAGAPPIELSRGDGAALARCIAFDVETLRQMPVAFAGTATAVDGETVTLSVDRWYRGGDADTAVLHAPAGMNALIAGFDIQVGQAYLITAADGAVNYCGFSGPASTELTAAFEAAFAR